MRRALIPALIVAAGCAGGREARDPASSRSQNSAAWDRSEAAHPSAAPSRRGSEDVGSSILGGMFGALFGGN